jgi:tRNA(fMet)-specific endonuclease VapC
VIYVLDTDHVSLSQRGHPLVSARLQDAGPTQLALSTITVEEQLRGWLAAVRNAATPEARVTAYVRLRMAVEYFASITLLDYTEAADILVANLRRQGLRIGTHDLRIAAVALTHGAVLVTRNARDFRQVPDLTIIDWSLPPTP